MCIFMTKYLLISILHQHVSILSVVFSPKYNWPHGLPADRLAWLYPRYHFQMYSVCPLIIKHVYLPMEIISTWITRIMHDSIKLILTLPYWCFLILLCIYRFFVGTSVSTFSFRIHEEREILGFDPKTTYNRFCGDTEKECEQPTHWKIVF